MKNDVIHGIPKRDFNARLMLKRLREVHTETSQRKQRNSQHPADGIVLREHLLTTIRK